MMIRFNLQRVNHIFSGKENPLNISSPMFYACTVGFWFLRFFHGSFNTLCPVNTFKIVLVRFDELGKWYLAVL